MLCFGLAVRAQRTGVCRKRSQCGQESYCNGQTLAFLGTLFILLLITYTKHIVRFGGERRSSLEQLLAHCFQPACNATHGTSKCGEGGLGWTAA